MYIAGEGGHLQVVELLLSAGAEVDRRDKVSMQMVYQFHQYIHSFVCTYIRMYTYMKYILLPINQCSPVFSGLRWLRTIHKWLL